VLFVIANLRFVVVGETSGGVGIVKCPLSGDDSKKLNGRTPDVPFCETPIQC
jgi:hypothetical protein